MPDGSATGGSAGAGGSAGKAGNGGAAGSGGKAGASGAAGAAGKAGSAGSAGGSSDGGMCPGSAPQSGSHCDVNVDCIYGPITCTCIDPGPNGAWGCTGGPGGDGGGGDGSGGMCPATQPDFGDPCPDSGSLGPCLYNGGLTVCTCDPAGVGWSCIAH
jgi:hypothetical protein